MIRKYPLLSLISLGIILGAGGGIFLQMPQVIAAGETKKNQDADIQAILAVIEQNMKARNEENLEAIKDTYHPNSPDFAKYKPLWEKIYQQADIKIELNKVEFLNISSNKARVRITSTNRKTGGNLDYKDQKITAIAKLQKFEGLWKFFSLELEKSELIN